MHSSFTQISRIPSIAHKANWAWLIQKVYEVDPLKCIRCGATMSIIALIDDTRVIERNLKHLSVWDPQPEDLSSAGAVPPDNGQITDDNCRSQHVVHTSSLYVAIEFPMLIT